jgi:poly(ADP-ribose) polymerase-like protein
MYINETIPTAETEQRFKIFEDTFSKKYKKRKLFHGTKLHNIESILREGFKINYNVRHAYGKGTYFSPNVSLSLSYTDGNKTMNIFQDELSYVFLCDVIVGEIGVDNYVISSSPS